MHTRSIKYYLLDILKKTESGNIDLVKLSYLLSTITIICYPIIYLTPQFMRKNCNAYV